jgi:hypothetical protein
MTVQLWAEEKSVRLFEERLESAAPSASLIDARMNDNDSLLEVTVEVPDVADWDLRYAVLAAANEVEAHGAMTVLCFFRSR